MDEKIWTMPRVFCAISVIIIIGSSVYYMQKKRQEPIVAILSEIAAKKGIENLNIHFPVLSIWDGNIEQYAIFYGYGSKSPIFGVVGCSKTECEVTLMSSASTIKRSLPGKEKDK